MDTADEMARLPSPRLTRRRRERNGKGLEFVQKGVNFGGRDRARAAPITWGNRHRA